MLFLFILFAVAVVVVPFTLEFNRWQKKGGKYWMGKFFLTIGIMLGIPFLLLLCVAVNLLWNIDIDEPVLLFLIMIILPIILYLLLRKLLK